MARVGVATLSLRVVGGMMTGTLLWFFLLQLFWGLLKVLFFYFFRLKTFMVKGTAFAILAMFYFLSLEACGSEAWIYSIYGIWMKSEILLPWKSSLRLIFDNYEAINGVVQENAYVGFPLLRVWTQYLWIAMLYWKMMDGPFLYFFTRPKAGMPENAISIRVWHMGNC